MRSTQESEQNIAILQYNLHKSQPRTHSILNDPTSSKYTILILQEQYWSKYTKSSLVHQSWTLIESRHPHNGTPRSAIYINNSKLNSEAFQIIDIPLNDITAVAINTPNRKPTLIINIYNPRDYDLISPLTNHLQNNLDPNHYDCIIIAGDFNLHHPLWNPPDYQRHDEQADEVVEMMMAHDMRLLIPPGTVTFPEANTAIDLVWGNSHAENNILKCQIATECDHGSDHYPIETILQLRPITPEPREPSLNYAKTKWKELKTQLQISIPTMPMTPLTTAESIDNFALILTTSITNAILATTPRKKPSPHSKKWWNDELKKTRVETNRWRNRYRRTRNEAYRNEWKEWDRKYQQKLKDAQRQTWRNFVEAADERTIWKVKRYMNSLPMQQYIPTLNETATTNESKAHEFAKAFFPQPPPADTSDIHTSEYPQPVHCETLITN